MRDDTLRLHVWLARAGIASRRAAEELIVAGMVRVNGRVVRTLGSQARLDRDRVEVRGRGLVTLRPLVHLALHKPAGFISSVRDPEGRRTVVELIGHSRAVGPRRHEGDIPTVVPVGRLDYDTEGLLLMSNDGELAHQLLHPRHHVPKTYLAKVQGRPLPAALRQLRAGLRLREDDGRLGPMTAPAEVESVRAGPRNSWLRLTLHEGHNRQVKRMFAAVGHRVARLIRTDFAGLALGELPAGGWRHLTAAEVEMLAGWAGRLAKSPMDRRMRSHTARRGGVNPA